MQFLFFIILIITFDQLTKILAINYLQGNSIQIITGFLDLNYIQNTGAAFGIMQNRNLIFLLVTPIILLVLIGYHLKYKSQSKLITYSIIMIIGGALGNYIDRIRLGYVIDFIDFKVWPVFNVADSFIVIGTILLAYSIMYIDRKETEGEKVG